MSEAQHAWEPADPLLRAVAGHWDEIMAAASHEQRARLRELVSGAAEPDPTEAQAAIADELLDILPADHPVIRILRSRVLYSSGVQVPARTELADSLRRLCLLVLSAGDSAWPANGYGEPTEPAHSPPATPVVDDFDRLVQARLLALPALSAADLRRGHVGSADSHLIRLPGPDSTWKFPAFQFATDASPWPVVQEINELLNAENDPWGVVCWWVDPHERLNAAPADLLGMGQDDLLRWAAMAVGEEF